MPFFRQCRCWRLPHVLQDSMPGAPFSQSEDGSINGAVPHGLEMGSSQHLLSMGTTEMRGAARGQGGCDVHQVHAASSLQRR